jgi:hypothetical protein
VLFFVGFAAGALMGTACLYYLLLRDVHQRARAKIDADRAALEVPKVRTRLTNRERTIEL